MTIISKASIEAQIHRWLRHDWRRYVQRGSKLEKLYEEIERKYRPDQARVLPEVQAAANGRMRMGT